MEKEELKEKILLDPIWNLEVAEANLTDDIDFLHCIEEEYFTGEQKEYAPCLYWQLGAIIRTLRKSLECNQMNMRKSIDAIYEEKRATKEGAN